MIMLTVFCEGHQKCLRQCYDIDVHMSLSHVCFDMDVLVVQECGEVP